MYLECQTVKLDPDQAQLNVGPDLGPNCLQRLTLAGTEFKLSDLYFLIKQVNPLQSTSSAAVKT